MMKKLTLLVVCLLISSVALADKAPEIGIKDTKGKTWTVEKLEKDKVYFVEFWATWCATCKKIAPTLTEFVKDNRGKDFEFLSVSVDTDKRALAAYLREKKPKYPVLLDPTFKMAQAWGAVQVPKMFLVKNGEVLWSKTGNVTRKELDDALNKVKASSLSNPS